MSPEVLAPHPPAVPSPGGPPKNLGGPYPLAQSKPPSVGWKVRGEPRQCVGNVLCRVLCWARRGKRGRSSGCPISCPGPHYSWLMGLLRSEKHRRGAGVGYSFDLLDQSLLQTWACLGWREAEQTSSQAEGIKRDAGQDDGGRLCVYSSLFMRLCVWYMCVWQPRSFAECVCVNLRHLLRTV